MGVLPAGLQEDAPEEEVRQVRREALRSLTKSILTATIVNVVSEHKIILSERPRGGMVENPSQQQLDADHLAVLKDNMGQVVEVILPLHLCHIYFVVLGCVTVGKAMWLGRLLRPICTAT